jgi:hypothetical protein
MSNPLPPGLDDALRFPLNDALQGRRARRFSLGAEIPDGMLRYCSSKPPLPLEGIEKEMVLSAVSGITGWHYMISHNPQYAPFLPNYSGSAWGRTFPSAAGFHTSEVFYTDDDGVYHMPSRDGPPLGRIEEICARAGDEDHPERTTVYYGGVRVSETEPPTDDADRCAPDAFKGYLPSVEKISDGRLQLPPVEAHIESHNHWCVNRPGSLLVIPVADLAQHMILGLCYLVKNGMGIYDDINHAQVPELSRFSDIIDLDKTYPLSFLETQVVTEASVEIGTSCYAGMLQLQAMGLGGWMFDGINPFSVLGASGDPDVPGLGFRFDTDPRWPLPNPTGLEGHFEGACPPHCKDMREAVDKVIARKFNGGGPFHRDTPGPWRESPLVRGSAQRHSTEFRECVSLMCQYILDTFGKFPGTVPTIWAMMYLQAHHLDLEFYDAKFKPGAYLETHARHMERWHPGTK